MHKILLAIAVLLFGVSTGYCQEQAQLSPVTMKLSCEGMGDRFAATWAEGGGIKSPSIVLRVVLKNNTDSAISLGKQRLTIEAIAENSRRRESKNFR